MKLHRSPGTHPEVTSLALKCGTGSITLQAARPSGCLPIPVAAEISSSSRPDPIRIEEKETVMRSGESKGHNLAGVIFSLLAFSPTSLISLAPTAHAQKTTCVSVGGELMTN